MRLEVQTNQAMLAVVEAFPVGTIIALEVPYKECDKYIARVMTLQVSKQAKLAPGFAQGATITGTPYVSLFLLRTS